MLVLLDRVRAAVTGAAKFALETGIAYANERVQFHRQGRLSQGDRAGAPEVLYSGQHHNKPVGKRRDCLEFTISGYARVHGGQCVVRHLVSFGNCARSPNRAR
jgi:hypothetical protein